MGRLGSTARQSATRPLAGPPGATTASVGARLAVAGPGAATPSTQLSPASARALDACASVSGSARVESWERGGPCAVTHASPHACGLVLGNVEYVDVRSDCDLARLFKK